MNEVKILPWVGYNQLQAQAFGLTHTQAIIMNYIVASLSLGGWADTKEINGKVYYRAHSSKFLSDMPTLDVSPRTLTRNVTELVSKGLLDREIIDKTKPYFRATEKWLYYDGKGETNCPSNLGQIVGQYNNITNKIKKEKTREEIEKIINELSSYLEGKKKHINVYELDNIDGGGLIQSLVGLLKEVESGERELKLESKRKIDGEYINEIKDVIVELAKRYDKMDLDMNGMPTQNFLGMLITEVEKLFDWYTNKGKTIKDLKATIRTWFNKYFQR